MTTQIWVHGLAHPAFRNGGWAYVVRTSSGLTGRAGGDRNTLAPRMALSGLLDAATSLPTIGAMTIVLTDPGLTRLAHERHELADRGWTTQEGEPVPDRDFWIALAAKIGLTQVSFELARLAPNTPMGFVAAWAEFAADKAKASGAFISSLPKPNLAKFPG